VCMEIIATRMPPIVGGGVVILGVTTQPDWKAH